MRPRSSRRLSLPASRFFLLICGLALILSALLMACGGEVVEQNGSGQGTRPAEARVEEGTPTATRAATTGADASTPQSGAAPTAGGQAEEGTPTATRATPTGAAASTPQSGSAPTPEAAARSASSTGTASTGDQARAEGSELEEYAAEHAGGPGAIYIGDIRQLVGPPPAVDIYAVDYGLRDIFRLRLRTWRDSSPTPAAPRPTPTPFGRAPAQSTPTPIPTPSPTPFPTDEVLLDPDGNVTLKALEQHLYIYESPIYAELIEKAKLTNPTPLTSSGEEIRISHKCSYSEYFPHEFDLRLTFPGAPGFMPCTLLSDYFAPNLRNRTNGQVEFVVEITDFPGRLEEFTRGYVDSATIVASHLGGAMEIQNLWGIYSSREQQFEANQAIIKDVEELVLAGTGGVIMSHSWYSGNDLFISCQERIDTPDGFAGKNFTGTASVGLGITSSRASIRDSRGSISLLGGVGNSLEDWIDGMGATVQGDSTDCRVNNLGRNSLWWGQSDSVYPRFTEYDYEYYYMIGPLPNFSFQNNVIQREVWNEIPADLQQIILEEAAKSELEALRLAAVHNEAGLIRTIEAAEDERSSYRNSWSNWEFIPFSEEMKRRSLDAAMNSVIPGWVNRLGGANYPIITDTFNNKLGPIVGLRINPDGSVVKTN